MNSKPLKAYLMTYYKSHYEDAKKFSKMPRICLMPNPRLLPELSDSLFNYIF